ncbi:MAG: class 1 isoprenoid biosynthesis enzyme [Myxococcales bacterium]|nr:class 1 isoprenoid biosynthesis enzyme [Myxococcales bacterium]
MTTTPKLNVLLGVRDEPDLTHTNRYIADLLRRLASDPDRTFLVTAHSLPRTKKSIPAVAVITHFMMRDALEAGAIGSDELYLLFLHVLYVLVIDDHMDLELSPRIDTLAEVKAYADGLVAACRAGDADHEDPIVRYICRATQRLRGYPAFERYAPIYFHALNAMMEGMVQEFKNRDPSAVNLDLYMTYAAHSVGSNLGLTASLILLDDPVLYRRLDRLTTTFEIVSSIIRYSNDIRSYEREIAEGKFSSLILAAQKFGIALDEVNFNQQDILRIIQAMMISDVYDLRDCVTYLESGGHFESVIINTVLGVVCLYEQADFHTLVLNAGND